jgi:nucleotide-binding universal stress UspA family protein
MRDVLVHANDCAVWSDAVAYAAGLAAALDGNLTAAYVYPTPAFMVPAYGASALLDVLVEQNQRLERECLCAERQFLAWAAGRGVARARWQVAQGYLPSALGKLANWHDVLVLGRNDDVPWESLRDVGAMVLRSDLPCIVVPFGRPHATPARVVALAWNGAPEGLRAIHAALPLLAGARIVVLNGRRREPLAGFDWRPPFEIELYLRNHGLEAESLTIDADDADAGEALLQACERIGAELLVMGAYGRNRFSEWLLGGATRHVLQHARLPVLLRH